MNKRELDLVNLFYSHRSIWPARILLLYSPAFVKLIDLNLVNKLSIIIFIGEPYVKSRDISCFIHFYE
ncbi:hypothetical protein MNBD_GAMMA09-1915 [hydrothermal vent metagenome]|uniref:Uncharacterized protein n=1 Tax=hydrothermal vent metagenome TaxID=652676 RepID=A0A3B0Y036_9ZZZZ